MKLTPTELVIEWIVPVIGAILTLLLLEGVGLSRGWGFLLILPGSLAFQWIFVLILIGIASIFESRNGRGEAKRQITEQPKSRENESIT